MPGELAELELPLLQERITPLDRLVRAVGQAGGLSGDELLSELKRFVAEQKLEACYIATCVGSLQAATLRLANADRDTPNEIKSRRTARH